METIGVGVIGCGGMGRSLATSAHAVKGIAVIRVSDLQETLAEKLGCRPQCILHVGLPRTTCR